MNASILSHCSICSCGNTFGYLVFQRFHRANIAWNSRKEEDWCRIVLSMSDGSSRAGNLLRIYKSLMATFTQCLTDILLTNRDIILFHESRHFYHRGLSQLDGVGSTALIHPCHNTI